MWNITDEWAEGIQEGYEKLKKFATLGKQVHIISYDDDWNVHYEADGIPKLCSNGVDACFTITKQGDKDWIKPGYSYIIDYQDFRHIEYDE